MTRRSLTQTRRFWALLGGAFLLLSPTASWAQDGFALDNYDPAVTGSDWFDGDSLDFRGHGRPALGLTGNYVHEPLVARDENGDVVAAPVSNQLFLHLGAAVNLWDRLRLEMMLPLAVWNEGKSATVSGVTYSAPSGDSLGDLRLGADVRLAGKYQGPFSLALGVQAHLPTGTREAYTSDGATRLGGRLMVAGDLGWFAYSARLGVRGHFEEAVVDGVTLGTELTYGATAGVRFAKKKGLLGVEWWGGAGLASDNTFDPSTVPQELLGTFNYRVGDVLLGAAAGPGLTEGLGTPVVRGLLRLVWFPAIKPAPEPPPPAPPPPPPDCDGDGVINGVDACPAEPGLHTDDPKTNGCPPPSDRDGDQIIDTEDACVLEPGVETTDPKTNGCPPPPPDIDNDGILNEDDACPQAPGRKNADPKRNGCPIVIIKDDSIEILQRVEFVTASATIQSSSHELLDDVAAILKEHPELEVVEVEGHTDNRGAANYNRKLSKTRAESVKKYLVAQGVEESRLLAGGRGPDVPIASNDTEDGRATNRRVEFHIRKRKPTPTPVVDQVSTPAPAVAPEP